MINKPSSERVAAVGWFKSSYSAPNNECVEVANLDEWIGVRDSKTFAGPVLVVTPRAFTALVNGLRNGAL
ncbi:DUF397 domain-containing protein [Streptomyces niveus]|uniref:DUF397 domain-containing protein n=1 Tax=Streptomyces niveus TaxID=193462 RepID=UPI00342133F3